ncbi:MAG: class I SAM-dependent methyltransferase [Saprospiraceae bacterium]|nr:class I SAM-dependent methyltransferase [Saprospiraceae bacterium]
MEQSKYDWILNNQDIHWWFVGRNKVIDRYIQKIGLTKNSTGRILDIGTGFGAPISTVKNYGTIDAVEPFKDCHTILKEKGVQKIIEIDDFPFHYPDEKYDLVCLFDVLEHIENDRLSLDTIFNKLLNPNGHIIMTVPAYMFLWTSHDTENKHFRRYTRSELIDKVTASGFKDIQCSYFMSLLFPIAALQRLIMKALKKDAVTGYEIPFYNSFFNAIFSLEQLLLKYINFPFGLSIIITAKR